MTAPADSMTESVPDSLIGEEDLAGLVGDVFTGLVGPSTEPPWPAAPGGPPLPVVGWLAVRGGWHAEVVVSCSRRASVVLASRLFALGATAVADRDLRDVAGELANVLGGNLKSLMPGPSVLSLPHTALDGVCELAYTHEALRCDLQWLGEPLRVQVLVPDPATPFPPEVPS